MISFRLGPHAAARAASKDFGVSFCLHNDSQPTSYTSSSELSTPFRGRWGVLASKLLRFRSRDDKVATRAALDRTVAHIIDHNSGLERAVNEKLKDLALPLSSCKLQMLDVGMFSTHILPPFYLQATFVLLKLTEGSL